MGRPVECAISNDTKSHAISDSKIKRFMFSSTNEILHDYQTYQLDALLGNVGRELGIKLFNSLVSVETKDLEELVSTACDEMQKALKSMNIHAQYSKSIFLDYFTLQIMKLINSGVYSQHNGMPVKFKSALFDVIEEPSAEKRKEMLNCLNNLWDQNQVVYFIEEVIENIALQYLLKNNLEIDHNTILKIVTSFFLLPNKKTSTKISDRIINKLGICHD